MATREGGRGALAFARVRVESFICVADGCVEFARKRTGEMFSYCYRVKIRHIFSSNCDVIRVLFRGTTYLTSHWIVVRPLTFFKFYEIWVVAMVLRIDFDDFFVRITIDVLTEWWKGVADVYKCCKNHR